MTTKKLISRDVYKKMDEHETLIESKEVGLGIFNALGLELLENVKKIQRKLSV